MTRVAIPTDPRPRCINCGEVVGARFPFPHRADFIVHQTGRADGYYNCEPWTRRAQRGAGPVATLPDDAICIEDEPGRGWFSLSCAQTAEAAR